MTKAFVKFSLLTASLALTLFASDPLQAATVEATWNSAGDVPVTAAGYDATGNSINLTLNFTPLTGTTLTVVKNTGHAFITGAFSNLAQGQAVKLSFGGVWYPFVANYYGGSGNDLVLQWASIRTMAWGEAGYGQLGNNFIYIDRSVPVAVEQSGGVLFGRTVVAVAVGEFHSLALCSDGTLAAWGNNFNGQLGNNSNTQSNVPVAVQQSSGVLSGKTVIAVAAGDLHSLALCADGTIAAWGNNGYGQLGNNSTTNSSVPVAVNGSGVLAGKTVVAIAAGAYCSLALCADGTLAAWGNNGYGQLGNNSTTSSSVPVAVNRSGVLSGKSVIAIAVGGAHSFALCADGTLAAWGGNLVGQLGNNSTTNSSVPVAVRQSSGVLFGKTVIAVAAGEVHSVAVCSDGTMASWGSDYYGQLGDNASQAGSYVPVAVQQGTGVLSGKTVIGVATGDHHSLALCADGTAAAWGRNQSGQLGNGNTWDSTIPMAVSSAPLAAGERFITIRSGTSSVHNLALVATAPQVYQIAVSANNTYIADGDIVPSSVAFTDFGNVATTGGTLVRTFTISNPGVDVLTLGSVTVSGAHAADFSVTTQPAASLAIAESTTFQITFNPSAHGSRTATLSFLFNDNSGGNPFNFSIQGMGVTTAPTAIALSATSIAENNAVDAIVGTLSDTDIDPGDVPSFSLVTGAGSTDNGSFSIAGDTLKITTSADFETKSSYAIRIGVNDGQGGTFESPFTITITDELDIPILTTPTSTGIAATAADLGGHVTWDGAAPITERGVVYSATATNATPSIGGSGVTKVMTGGTTGIFTIPVTGLSPSTGYSFRAYATNSQGTAYSSVGSFSTTVTFSYTAAAQAPITASSFTASGSTVTLALGYAPATGTNLTVVNNTGLGLIGGAFSNLAQGQAVTLSYRAVTYHFVANYYGGTGNDLVLQWAGVHLMAWGYNNRGQLGINSTTDSKVPVAVLQSSGVLSGKTVVAVSAGLHHTLALCADGTVAAWGSNEYGQLGNNSATNSSVPVAVLQSSGVLSGKTVIAIAAGWDHSLALCSDGTLAAWGYNGFGQLGNGGSTSSSVPVAVQQSSGALSAKTVIAIAAGKLHSVALCTDGTVAAWGSGYVGQMGNGSSASYSFVPVAVQQNSGVLAGKTVIAVAAGQYHNLALCADGTMAAWGEGRFGHLGNNSTTASNVPVAVQQSSGVLAGRTVIAIAAGGDHCLALCADGTLAVWGSNYSGELGNGSKTDSAVPVAVPQSSGPFLGKTAIGVSGGNAHSLALCSDGTSAAWGAGFLGQLGANITGDSSVPVAVSTSPLAAGEHFTFVRSGSSANSCFGLVAAPRPPEITVSGNGVDITDGDITPNSSDFTDFGSLATASGSVVRTFTISNSGPYNNGTAPLTLGSVTVGGANAADFTVTTQPAANVDIGGSTTFEVTFNPSANGLRSAMLSFIFNDHRDENFFNFGIQGRGLNTAPTAIALSATSIAENNTPNATVGTLSATDADSGDVPVFSLVSGAGSTDNVRFTIAGSALKLTPSADFETKSSYAIRIGVNDGQGGIFESPFTITISDELDVPIVTTPTVTVTANTGAVLGGNITWDGGSAITERGIVYAATVTNAAPSIGGSGVTQITADGTTGAFTVPVTGLSPNKHYSFRAYATNAQGTSYTSVYNFSTTFTFTYTPFDNVPVTAANFRPGGTITLSLGYAPETGTNLMVVNNTGRDFLEGTFSNLAQGQAVALSFGGVIYRFVANYYGGSGNDLVLHWANVRPMAWGNNLHGQLGNNGMAHSVVPTAVLQSGVLAGKTVIALAAEEFHSLALCSDGTLAAWGSNDYGQLGDGSATGSTVPVAVLQSSGVLAGKTVIAVAVGTYHSLVLCSDGTVAAWGDNGSGQLGNGSTTDSSVPVAVQQDGLLAGKRVAGVAAGRLHSLALCVDGTLAAWGNNEFSQLGNNSTTDSSVPVAVLQSSGVLFGKSVIAVTAGRYHSLALSADGTVAAWGQNSLGQLGTNSTTQSTVPVAVRQFPGILFGKSVIAVAAGSYHSLALCSDGTLAAWGYNSSGQLGINSTAQRNLPVAVTQSSGVLSGKTVVAVAAGQSHSLALCSDRTVAAWGYNGEGQLGDNSTTQSLVPVAVSTTTLAAGERFTNVGRSSSAGHTLALVATPPVRKISVSGNSVDIAPGDSTPSSTDFTDFGTVVLSNTQVTHTFTIGNVGDVALNLTGNPRVQVSGPAAEDFKVTGLPASPLAPNATTTFSITFDPSLPGLRSAEILIANNDPLKGSFTFAIQGFRQPNPEITVAGNSVDILNGDSTPATADFTDFGTVALANTQVTHIFTLGNEGNISLNLTGTPRVVVGGRDPADFEVTALPASPLAPGASTEFAVTFDPTLPGVRMAEISIANDDVTKATFNFTVQGFGRLSKPLAQSITFTAPATIYLAQSPLQLSATASSGLPVTLNLVSAPAGTTLVDGLLTCASTGTVKVQATQPGGGNYAAAKAVTLSLAIKANPTALTLTQLNQKYDGTPKPIGTEGGVGDVAITYTVNGAGTSTPPTNAGSYTVKAVAGTETKTGKLVIAKAPMIVTPYDKRKFAGQANPALTAAYSGFIAPDNDSVITQRPVLSTTAKTTSPGGAYPITAKGGVSANYIFVYRQGTLMVESFAGNYEALLTDEGGLPVGKLVLTVPTAGQTFTGKLYTAAETAAVSLAGTLATDAGNERAAGQATAKVKGISYVVNVTLPLYGDVLATATRDGVTLASASDGRKLLALPTGGKVRYAGAHTVVLEPSTPAGTTVPAGAGWATGTISTAGVLTLTGKLGDGTAFTTALAPDGGSDPGYRLFVQPYLPARAQSYLGGQFGLKAHPNAALPDRRYLDAANLAWTKAGKAADASYRAGFGPVTTVLTLDPWLAPSTANPLVTLLGLGGSSFGIAHSTTGNLAHDENLATSASLSATNVVKVLLPVANATKWKTTLVPRTGTFSGSFELLDGTPAKKRTVPFTGVLRQPPATPALPGTIIGDGHYLLPPLTGTEKTSGDVSFTRP